MTEQRDPSLTAKFGRQIRTRREALGWNQTELASKAGLHQAIISRIESAKGDPRISTIEKIVTALKLGEQIKRRLDKNAGNTGP